jgi:MmyB-like transcription regulator ligand binding domain
MRALIDELCADSARFRELWFEGTAVGYHAGIRHIRHPLVGDLFLYTHRLNTSYVGGDHVLMYRAESGSDSARALEELRSLIGSGEGTCRKLRRGTASNLSRPTRAVPWWWTELVSALQLPISSRGPYSSASPRLSTAAVHPARPRSTRLFRECQGSTETPVKHQPRSSGELVPRNPRTTDAGNPGGSPPLGIEG